jgi:NADPH:quinone reductase-like Zn-dependent oxidoreductase
MGVFFQYQFLKERNKMYAKIGEWYKSNQLKVPTHKNWSIEEFKEAIHQATGGPQQMKQRVKHLLFFAG